jgi:hypothetical protein
MFVPQFNKIAAPVHKLLKKDSKNDLEEGQKNAFQTLKQMLMSKLILHYSDFSKDLILTTDMSNEGAGEILSLEEIARERPIGMQVTALWDVDTCGDNHINYNKYSLLLEPQTIREAEHA